MNGANHTSAAAMIFPTVSGVGIRIAASGRLAITAAAEHPDTRNFGEWRDEWHAAEVAKRS